MNDDIEYPNRMTREQWLSSLHEHSGAVCIGDRIPRIPVIIKSIRTDESTNEKIANLTAMFPKSHRIYAVVYLNDGMVGNDFARIVPPAPEDGPIVNLGLTDWMELSPVQVRNMLEARRGYRPASELDCDDGLVIYRPYPAISGIVIIAARNEEGYIVGDEGEKWPDDGIWMPLPEYEENRHATN